MIKGGYILQPRIIDESDISVAPPYVREVWNYLLREANSKDNRYNGHEIKRGQLFRSYLDIREGTKWFIGWRKVMYTENHMKKAMKFLRDTGRIDTTKELGGVMITICKYDYYQDPKNYERTKDGTNEGTIEEPLRNQPLPDNNKNDKNLKNKKNDNNILMSGLSASDDLHEKIAFSFWILFKEKLAEYNINSTDLEKAKSKNWVTAIRLMMDSDKRTQDEIREVFTYLKSEKQKNEGFAWSKVIQSTETLRKKFEKVLRESRDTRKSKNSSTVSDAFKKQILEEAINSKHE